MVSPPDPVHQTLLPEHGHTVHTEPALERKQEYSTVHSTRLCFQNMGTQYTRNWLWKGDESTVQYTPSDSTSRTWAHSTRGTGSGKETRVQYSTLHQTLLPEHGHTVHAEPALERKVTPTVSSSRTWAHSIHRTGSGRKQEYRQYSTLHQTLLPEHGHTVPVHTEPALERKQECSTVHSIRLCFQNMEPSTHGTGSEKEMRVHYQYSSTDSASRTWAHSTRGTGSVKETRVQYRTLQQTLLPEHRHTVHAEPAL